MKLDKANILSLTDSGLDFFKFVIPELIQQGNKCKNVKNPFYDDTKASLSIFFKSGKWFFKDHGDDSYTGDMFSFAAFHYNLNLIAVISILITWVCLEMSGLQNNGR